MWDDSGRDFSWHFEDPMMTVDTEKRDGGTLKHPIFKTWSWMTMRREPRIDRLGTAEQVLSGRSRERAAGARQN
jgi:hypothetical protein